MTTINETIDNGLRNAGLTGYQRQAQPIVDALIQRERDLVSSVLNEAREQGLDVGNVTRVFEGLGFSMPVEQAAQGDLAQENADLRQRLASLEQFARNNGYNG